MEYNKPATKADIQHMIGWLESKDPRGMYDKGNTFNCLISQYVKEVKNAPEAWTGWTSVHWGKNNYKVPFKIAEIAYGEDQILTGFDTYGNALNRARHVLASMS